MEIVKKPWGCYADIQRLPAFVQKIIVVKKGELLSFQSHNYRDETWWCVSGTGTMRLADSPSSPSTYFTLLQGEKVFIPKGQLHQLIADKGTDVVIFEIQSGQATIEGDIVRYEDRYNRDCLK